MTGMASWSEGVNKEKERKIEVGKKFTYHARKGKFVVVP